MSANVLGEREVQLAREAAEWRLISLLFECPGEVWRKQLSALAEEVADADLKSAVEDALTEADEGLFHYAFGPGGPAPAREATYHQSVELGYLMSELQAYYNAFAYAPRTAEPPDHVSVEAGFIAYLKLKQLFALARRHKEQAETASKAVESFTRDHLSRIAQPLAAGLQQSGIGYLAKAGSALEKRTGEAHCVTCLPILQNTDPGHEPTCGELDA